MKKSSYVDSNLWVSEQQWLVSLSEQPTTNEVFSPVKIIIEGILQKKQFLVEYRILAGEDSVVKQITRQLYKIPSRLRYSRQYTVSYPVLPRECQVLDAHLETLLNQLLECESGKIKASLLKKFRVKTSLFSWCMDQVQKSSMLR